MATAGGTVVVEGLAQFRAAVRAAAIANPRQLTIGLKLAGAPILQAASAKMPRRTGLLAGSLSTSVRGARANIISKAPYGGGAEWGQQGKWSGFAKYGAPPRFVGKALDEKADEVARILDVALRQIITANGWFH